MTKIVRTYLRELPVGAIAYIVGYDKVFKGYQGKLLAMGLTPGTQFIVIRQASKDWPIILEVRGNLIQLTQPEADALCIEEEE